VERRLLCLPRQRQLNPAGYERLRRQVWWMITLDDRLDDFRCEKGEPDQPAHIVFGEALASYYQKLWIDDGMKKAAYPSA